MQSENLQISVSDTNLFDMLVKQTQNVKSAIKNMTNRSRKGKEPEHDSLEDDSTPYDYIVSLTCIIHQELAPRKFEFFGNFLSIFGIYM